MVIITEGNVETEAMAQPEGILVGRVWGALPNGRLTVPMDAAERERLSEPRRPPEESQHEPSSFFSIRSFVVDPETAERMGTGPFQPAAWNTSSSDATSTSADPSTTTSGIAGAGNGSETENSLEPFDGNLEFDLRFIDEFDEMESETSEPRTQGGGSRMLGGKLRTVADDRTVADSGSMPCFSAVGAWAARRGDGADSNASTSITRTDEMGSEGPNESLRGTSPPRSTGIAQTWRRSVEAENKGEITPRGPQEATSTTNAESRSATVDDIISPSFHALFDGAYRRTSVSRETGSFSGTQSSPAPSGVSGYTPSPVNERHVPTAVVSDISEAQTHDGGGDNAPDWSCRGHDAGKEVNLAASVKWLFSSIPSMSDVGVNLAASAFWLFAVDGDSDGDGDIGGGRIADYSAGIRGVGNEVNLATSAHWLFTTGSGCFWPDEEVNLGSSVYWLFAVCGGALGEGGRVADSSTRGHGVQHEVDMAGAAGRFFTADSVSPEAIEEIDLGASAFWLFAVDGADGSGGSRVADYPGRICGVRDEVNLAASEQWLFAAHPGSFRLEEEVNLGPSVYWLFAVGDGGGGDSGGDRLSDYIVREQGRIAVNMAGTAGWLFAPDSGPLEVAEDVQLEVSVSWLFAGETDWATGQQQVVDTSLETNSDEVGARGASLDEIPPSSGPTSWGWCALAARSVGLLRRGTGAVMATFSAGVSVPRCKTLDVTKGGLETRKKRLGAGWREFPGTPLYRRDVSCSIEHVGIPRERQSMHHARLCDV